MESRSVKAGTVRLEYYQHGNGPDAVMLVHGYASSARLWHLAMVELDPQRFRVIALNNRGAGNSDRSPSEAGYTVESFAQYLHHAVAALGLDGFTLVGHSMGGATVAQYALAHQSRLKALVLLNSTPLNGRPLAQGWDATIREHFRTGERPQGDMGFNALHVTESFKKAVLADIDRNPQERAIGGRRSMSQLRLRERLRELKVPTLVVGGDRDTTVGVDNLLADYLALPEDTRSLHIFHGIGHSPNVETPQRFAGLLTQFIGEANQKRQRAVPTSR